MLSTDKDSKKRATPQMTLPLEPDERSLFEEPEAGEEAPKPRRPKRTVPQTAPPPPPELTAADLEPEPEPEPEPEDWRAKVPTVSELNRKIRGHLENSFFDVWVRGEVSNFRKPASGHGYLVLKDANAQVRCVIFRPHLSKLRFELRDGMEVLVHGRVTVYEARGEYQIVADAMEPVGVGALQLAFEQLKEKLQREGLFDRATKKALPPLPRRIGVVTSGTGAAVRDILKVISRRFPDREVFVLPCAVQGDKAAPEIVSAIGRAVRWNQTHPERAIEVLIVGRGGGSIEDLWPFNEEVVARAIHGCPIPVVSAVGHEIDFTIADFVADVRAPTPSAAAEIVVPRKEELVYQVETRTQRLRALWQKRLEQARMHLDHLTQRLVDPRKQIQQLKLRFAQVTQQLTTGMRTRLMLARRRLEAGAQQLHLLSPLQVLGRGYSLTQLPDGTILRHPEEAKAGSVVTTRLAKGTFRSRVLDSDET